MSNSNDKNHNATSNNELPIAARVELGRQTQRFLNGAIVPFPKGYSGTHVLTRLGAKARKKCDDWRAAGYKITAYEYRSAEGEVIQSVIRFDDESAPKEIRPLRYCGPVDHGRPLFEMSAIDGQRPLYGLDRLADRPEARILVVEGEKTAEAAKLLFPDYVVITWMGGAGGVARTEMLALTNRSLIIWPDHDEPGRKAARTFANLAFKAGAVKISVVDVPREFPEGWDLADPAPESTESYESLQHLLDTARPVTPQEVEAASVTASPGAEQRRLLGYKPGYSRVEPQVVAHALQQLDPDMGRHPWEKIGRCIYFALSEAGLDVFDAWSKGSEAKYRAGEPNKMWRAFADETGFRAKPLSWLFGTAMKAAKEQQKNAELDADSVALAQIEELNEDHAFVVRGGRAAVAWEHFDPRFERYELTYLSKQDFTAKLVRQVALPSDDDQQSVRKKLRVPIGTYWFGSRQRRAYDTVYFSPGKKVGPGDLNLWQGFAVEAVDNPAGWSKFKEHIFDHVAGRDQASFDYIMDWMAFGVQRLAESVGTALVLVGPKGAGKSFVTETYGHLFGAHKFVTAHAEDLFGRFNARLEWTLLLGIEEAFAPQNRGADGKLKDLITRRELRLEDKFFSVWPAPNHLRIIMTSNNDRVVRADGFERRYAVFNVENPFLADPDARRAYFGAIVDQMEAGGYQAMLGELLARDITAWNREAIPETPALRRQKELSIINHPVAAWLYERLWNGVQITEGDPHNARSAHLWSETATVHVQASDVRHDFLNFAKANNLPYSDRMLALKLPELMPAGFKAVTRRDPTELNGTPTKTYPFPPLQEARAAFTAKTGLSFSPDV